MPKIRLKDIQRNRDPRLNGKENIEIRRLEVWKILTEIKVSVYKIESSASGYVIIDSDETLETLAKQENKTAFNNHGFELQESPEMHAKKTLVIKNVDPFVLSHSAEQIKENVERYNTWLKVTEVIKIPSAPTLMKIKCEEIQMVKRALQAGLVVHNQSIPDKCISQELHINISQCMKCYAYDHIKKDCQKPEAYKICSNCSSNDHTWLDCNNAFKKCVACNGDHPTMAMRCPNRKAIIKKERDSLEQKRKAQANTSYAQVANRGNTLNNQAIPQEAMNATQTQTIRSGQNAIINTALIFAMYTEATDPGSFQKTLDRVFQANGLAKVIIPTTSEEIQAIRQTLATTDTVTITGTSTSELESTEEEMQDLNDRKRERDSSPSSDSSHVQNSKSQRVEEEHSTTDDESNTTETESVQAAETEEDTISTEAAAQAVRPKERKQSASRFGLKLVHTSQTRMPAQPTNETLRQMLLVSKKLKFSFTGNATERELRDMIKKDEIDLTKANIAEISDQRFKSFKEGYFSLRSSNNKTKTKHQHQ